MTHLAKEGVTVTVGAMAKVIGVAELAEPLAVVTTIVPDTAVEIVATI